MTTAQSLSPKLADALNAQVTQELTASHAYLAMAYYFDAQDLPGFAAFFRAQSAEETTHATKLGDFVVKREANVTLGAIAAPTSTFQTPSSAIRAALKMEQAVTQNIHALYAMAREAGDYAAQTQLMWFIDEQVEEEDSFRTLLRQVEAAENDPWNLLTLDKDIGAGVATKA